MSTKLPRVLVDWLAVDLASRDIIGHATLRWRWDHRHPPMTVAWRSLPADCRRSVSRVEKEMARRLVQECQAELDGTRARAATCRDQLWRARNLAAEYGVAP